MSPAPADGCSSALGISLERMSNAAKFRKKAAEFEQLKQFDRAIASYVAAIEESEKHSEEVDVATLNKVGDLTLRQGRVADAVTYYERAVEHYATAGLFNNSIALCNKILRNAPGRANVYLTLGRVCARKGLRGDATRNFLEYATRMQQAGRIDEGMRALAEVAEMMPELSEVRRLVDEHAARAGLTLRRRTPLFQPAQPDPSTILGPGDKSRELVFLDVEYEARSLRRTPLFTAALHAAASPAAPATPPTPAAPPAPTAALATPATPATPTPTPAAVGSLDDVMLFDPTSVDPSQFEDLRRDDVEQLDGLVHLADLGGDSVVPLDGLTASMPETSQASGPADELQWLVSPEPVEGVERDEDASADMMDFPSTARPADTTVALDGIEVDDFGSARVDAAIDVPLLEVHPAAEMDGAIPAGTATAERAETFDAERDDVSPFRLDPHDFILPGELPPLVLGDAMVAAGLEPSGMVRRAIYTTPSLPIAAVAAEANAVAASRRDTLRSQVVDAPRDWVLRRRHAEALFEAGELEAALAELETAMAGFADSGDVSSAAEVAEELVHVASDRVPYHQKRVELAVRLNDQQRLRLAYLDLADTLVESGDEGRAHAVYARVLEIDPVDERARAALGAAAPPLPSAMPERADDRFVDLADWLRDDDEPSSTRMRMREPAASGDEQADFDSLLRHFKEGVARSLGDEDYESHYDLGVAYKEMGLLDDAIGEFQKALRSKSHRLPAYEALGQCFVEQERFQVAATVLSRALHEPGLTDDNRVGVLYLLAYSSEALQRWDEAKSYYQRVYATDINFRDAASRLASLDRVAR